MDKEPELMDGEECVMRLSPHPLSFIGLYLIFLYPVILGVVFGIYHEDITGYFSDLFLMEAAGLWTAISIWWLLLIVPAIIIALLRITWKWLALYLSIATVFTLLKMYTWVELIHMNIGLISIGVIGLVISDYYRRQHRFYITDNRIITQLDFLGKKSRSLMYSNINDLVIRKPVLGNWLNYGTILPVTASGFGLTDNMSIAGAGIGGSGKRSGFGGGLGFGGLKSMQDPRGRPYYILYGVRNPEKIYRLISEFIRETEATPILKKISEDVETISKQGLDQDPGDETSEDTEPKDNTTS